MAEQEYFKQALSNFTFDVASGGAIRHLADHGYTAEEISKRLDFPTPFERVQDTIWKHYLETGVLLLEEPGTGAKRETFDFVTEYDEYGRKSFRRVTVRDHSREPILWKKSVFHKEQDGELLSFLSKKCAENGEASAYISCDFGLRSKREPEQFLKALQVLEKPERDYILGLPWERRLAYHRLNERMRSITAVLYRHGEYHGCCYFMDRKEMVTIQLPPVQQLHAPPGCHQK